MTRKQTGMTGSPGFCFLASALFGMTSLIVSEPSIAQTETGSLWSDDNPCQLAQGETQCDVTIEWTKSGAAVGCLWKITPSLAIVACQASNSGSKFWPFANQTGQNFELLWHDSFPNGDLGQYDTSHILSSLLVHADPAPPSTPGGLNISPSLSIDGFFTATWSPVTGADFYQFGCSWTETDPPASGSNTAFTTGTSETPSAPYDDHTYSCSVQACNGGGCSASSSPAVTLIVDTTLPPGSPPAPTGLAIDPNPSTDGFFTATWSSVTGADSYQFGCSWTETDPPASGSNTAFTTGTSETPSVPYDDHTYSCSVQACNGGGCSASSSPAVTLIVDTTPPQGPPASTAVIDVLFIYSPLFTPVVGQLNAELDREVSVANTALERSGVSAHRYNKVAVVPAPASMPDDVTPARDWAAALEEQEEPPGLLQLRDQHVADVVAMVVTGGNPCGQANAGWYVRGPASPSYKERAYFVVRKDPTTGISPGDCPEDKSATFAHEVGHVLGAQHHIESDAANRVNVPYNHGYMNDNLSFECEDLGEGEEFCAERRFRTIMAARQCVPGVGGVCPLIPEGERSMFPIMSSPLTVYQPLESFAGAPVGNGEFADVVRLFGGDEPAWPAPGPVVAGFRNKQADSVPVLQMTALASEIVTQQPIALSANAHDVQTDESVTDLTAGIIWRTFAYDPACGGVEIPDIAGGTYQATLEPGCYLIEASVTDNGGNEASRSVELVVPDP